MMITDAHLHLPVGDAYPTLQSKKEKLLAELDENHAARCIVIADSWQETEIGTTDELTALFPRQAQSRVFVVGGISPLVQFEETLADLRRHLEQKQIVGIKLYPGHEPFCLTDARLSSVYETALQYQVPVLFHSGWEHPEYGDADAAAAVLERYPELRLVCCHCWYPQIGKCMQMLAYPNLYFDLSSVADEAEVPEQIASGVRRLTEAVPERVLFGSDSFGCSMAQHIRFLRDMHLPPETERLVFHENAGRLYQLEQGRA
ncbi:MAG: amidohydrolase [Oscillospiraceae bacterium]|nr:amidohydrolase [Oscillospiraceae bacterium]